MSAGARAGFVAAVVAVGTLGEGGAAPWSLLVLHLLLATAVVIFAAFAPPSGYVPSRGPTVAWLGFAALAGAGAFVAPYAYAAWLIVIELIAFGSLFWLVSGDPKVSTRFLAPGVAILASMHGIVALVQRASGSPRPASTFLNPNHLAAWLAAAALFLAGTMLAGDRSLRSRGAYGLAIIVALAGIVVTGSRGAALGITTGAAALAALGFSRLPSRGRRGMLAVAAVLVLAAIAGVALRFRGGDDPYRFHRTRIWGASIRAALSSPISGVGPGQFAVASRNLNFPLDEPPLRFGRTFKTPHSDVLRAVCEFGFPAGIMALVAVLSASVTLFRRRASLTFPERGALAALIGLSAQACVDDLSTRPALALFGAALAGLLLAQPRVDPPRAAGRAAGTVAAVLVALALGVSEVAGFVAWDAVHDLPRGRLDAVQLDRLRRSLAWNPMQPAGWERLSEHFVGDGRSWSLPDYAAAREAVEHARRLQPVDAFYALAAARVEATASLSILPFEPTRDRAARLYDDAMRLARTDATIPLEAAKFLLQAGDSAGARRAASRAIEVEPRAAAPRLWLAQAILRQDGPSGSAEAQRLLDEALALAPRDGEIPESSYEAALRSVDPELVGSLRRQLGPGTER